MSLMTQAYITGVGAYLPGDPVDNEQLAARFGDGTRRDAALRKRALAANGIRTRHYAVDDKGMTQMLNEELAAHAVQRALADRGLLRAQRRRAWRIGGQPAANHAGRSRQPRRDRARPECLPRAVRPRQRGRARPASPHRPRLRNAGRPRHRSRTANPPPPPPRHPERAVRDEYPVRVLPDPRPVPAGRALTAAGYLAAQH